MTGIKDLVPDTYSEHWQKTVDFLKIVTDFWPRYLADNGLTSPEARRNALILAEAERISKLKSDEVVIVAGVTGSIPATVTLMRAVAARPSGAIVLPGLDQSLDDESWDEIAPEHPEHPQFGLKKLLDELGIKRTEVQALPGAEPDAARQSRATFFSEAMRPSATTARWHSFAAKADRATLRSALAGVSLIEAPAAQDEAETVALILREAVEKPGQTAALVSPDRLLARRVAIRLEAWGIRVDDSAGRPFAKTVPGAFLSLVIGVAVSDFAPAETMALLRHPLCRLGFQAFDIRRFARALEISAFRAPYLGRGVEGIAAALDNAERDRAAKKRMHRAAQRLWKEDCDGARELVTRLAAAFDPLTKLYAAGGTHALSAFARAHAAAAEALAVLPEGEAATADAQNPLWQGEAGEAATRFFAELLAPETPSVDLRAADYADLYATLLARENVRERTARPSARRDLGAVRGAAAAAGRPDPRLAQRRHVAGSGRARRLAQPPDAPRPWAAVAGRRDRPRGARLRVAARRRDRLPDARRKDRRRSDRAVALADAADGAARGLDLASVLEPDQPWLAWARARDRIKRRIEIKAPATDARCRASSAPA